MTDSADLVGQTLDGRYRVLKQIGVGGMGSIYVAEQSPLGRKVALKVISDPGDPVAQKRFKREARIISQLLHPNIVTLHDFGTAPDGALFIAMELLVGESVGEHVDHKGPFSWQQSLPILTDIASGLRAAHEQGVIHRDLQPDNIMLVEGSGRSDFAKLLDFGLARLEVGEESRRLTQVGSVVGTPGFVAPECLEENEQVDARADLYSLGVIWFEMLTGKPPFDAPNGAALILKHATDPVPLFDEVVPKLNIPSDVEDAVRRLLEKRPQDRLANADALLDVLAELSAQLSGPNVVSPPPATFDDDIHNQKTQLQTPSLPRSDDTATVEHSRPPEPAEDFDAPTWADDDAGEDGSDTIPYPNYDATTQASGPRSEAPGPDDALRFSESRVSATELVVRSVPKTPMEPQSAQTPLSPTVYLVAAAVFAAAALGFGALILWWMHG